MPDEYYFRNALQTPKKRSNNLGRRVLAVLLLGLFSLLGLAFLSKAKQTQNLISPINESNQVASNLRNAPILGELIRASFNFNDSALSKMILQRLDSQPGDYAIVVEGLNPDSKQRFFYNDHKVLPAASLYKLFLMAAAYRAFENGSLTEQTVISVPEDHLIDILGSKEFGYGDTEGDSITYSVEEMLNRIAAVSDNYAAIMLAEKLGWDKIQDEADTLGAKDTSIKNPISTTAADISLFFQKLYDKQIVSTDASDNIIDLLSQGRINNRIPDQLPEGLKIAHKTGELSKVRHDAGVVFLDQNPYLIVLMSENLEGEDDGVELFSNISKDVYEYFSSAEPR